MTEILVVGMAVVDFVFAIDVLPQAAEKYRAKDAQIVGGGPAANAAVGIARLGGKAKLGARLGSDSLADLIEADLKMEGVETSLMHRAAGGASSFSSVYVDTAGERQIVNFRGCNLANHCDWLDDASPASAVLVDTRWTEGALKALQLARKWEVPGIVDGEAPIDPRLLAEASHVALSRQGLASLSDKADLAEALADIRDQVSGWACVTDGENGVFYTDGDEIAHCQSFSVEVKDTLGAGDLWHGAFALKLAEGASECEAIRFANAAAAIKCTRFGGRAGSPDRDSVESFIREAIRAG